MESKELQKAEYKLIPMSDIRDEIRLLATAWCDESNVSWIGDRVKLASDIQNYADWYAKKQVDLALSDKWITNDYPQDERSVLIKMENGDKHLGYCDTVMRIVDDLEIIWRINGIGVIETDEVFGWMDIPL